MTLTGANWRLYQRLSGPNFRTFMATNFELMKAPLPDFVDDPAADEAKQQIHRLAHLLEQGIARMRLSAADRARIEFPAIAEQMIRDRGPAG